jgi:hypothetical protein
MKNYFLKITMYFLLLVYLQLLIHGGGKVLKLHPLPNPLQFYSQSSQKKLCYTEQSHRFEEITGTWINSSSRISNYWNLSCPMELSKQSCTHFGRSYQDHAEYAARLQFVPSFCSLLSLPQLLPYFSSLNKTIVFLGNSLGRQIMQGIACNAYHLDLIDRFDLSWFQCNEGKPNHQYPCQGALNCITCGNHSGFPTGSKIYFKSGTILADFFDYDKIDLSKEGRNTDMIVVQRKYISAYRNVQTARSKNNGTLPKLMVWHAWDPHFVTGGGLFDGKYNETELLKLKNTVGVVDCLNSVAPMIPLQSKHELFKVWPLDGFLQLEGVHTLGAAKVGNSVGKYGDCQHFCAPGPPDIIALAMIQLIIAIFSA